MERAITNDSLVLFSGETWKAVPGWEGYYEVSTLGRIKRLARDRVYYRNGKGSRRYNSERIREFKSRGLTLSGGGYQERVHNAAQLILRTFVGPAPKGKPFALHRDDNFKNNKLENLYWGSRQDNSNDAHRNGRTRLGHSSIRIEL